jgi:hypothetical protein
MSLRYASECRHNFGTTPTAATINAIAAVPGNRIFVYRLLITTSAAGTLKLQDTTAVDMSQAFQLLATLGGGVALDVPFNNDPWWFTGQEIAGAPLVGQGRGINFIVTGTPTVGWDIWWDAHA